MPPGRFLGGAAIVVTLSSLLACGPGAAQGLPEKLFLEPPAGVEATKPPPVPPFARVQAVRLNPAAAAQFQGAAGAPPWRVLLNLFSNEQHTALIERREMPEPGRVVCRGRVEGQPGSQVIFALCRGALAGSVFIPGHGNFQIQDAGAGIQRVGQVDVQRVPPCGVRTGSKESSDGIESPQSVAGPATPSTADSPLSPPPAPGETVVDLLVVYTPAAREGAGGIDGMSALIDVAVAEANAAFENSQVNARLRLVYRTEVDYEETGDINKDLDNLEEDEPGESPLYVVHLLRGQYQADLVCMITETTGGPLGLANLMRNVGVSFVDEAFSIVQRQFANTYYVLAHELGHNMGCQHDRASSSSGGAFSFSYAYRFVVSNLNYHTVMAPQPGLPIPYFSNPDVSFLGVPTGMAEGLPNSANNARTLNLTAATVAQFSSLVPTGLPPQVTLVGPTNGATFIVPAVVVLTAEARDEEGETVTVEFRANGDRVGEVHSPPFTMLWTNATPGAVSLRAVATDSEGWKTACAAITVTFRLPPPVFDAAMLRPLPDGAFALGARGIVGQSFRIDASEDWVEWVPIVFDGFTNEVFTFIDREATNFAARFYRIVPWP